MKDLAKRIATLSPFLVELLVYAGFVAAYFFLVLHFLEGRLKEVFDDNKVLYAILALALIGVQGLVLEMLTSALFGAIRPKHM